MLLSQRFAGILFFVLASFGVIQATTPKIFTDEATSDFFVQHMSGLLNDFPQFGDEEYKRRLAEISGAIEYRLDPVVKERILVRTELYRQSTENILGLSDVYFPIFEEHLAKYDLPHQLKYLPIIESNLNPIARSHAAAVGLWQFIPSTGQLYKLQMNKNLDERSDTYKASEAAALMLKQLYEYYSDWSLALAAYNCGAGRINGAIKKAGSHNYWEARKFLPLETQKYVPYFMAMVYVGEFHALHELKPVRMPQDLTLTDTIMLYQSKSMFRLAQEVGLSVDTLKFLNPAYHKSYIPGDAKGRAIVLPARVVARLRGYEAPLERALGITPENPIRAVRRVQSEAELLHYMKAYRCTRKDVLVWNELPDGYQVQAGDLLVFRRYHALRDAEPIRSLAAPAPKPQAISVAALRVVSLGETAPVRADGQMESYHNRGEQPKAEPLALKASQAEATSAKPVVAQQQTSASKPASPTTPSNTSFRQATEVAATKPSESENLANTAQFTTPKPSFERQAKPMKAEIEESVLQDRSRERRLRSAPLAETGQGDAPSNNLTERNRERNLRQSEASNQGQILQPKIEDNPNEPFIYYTVQGSESLADLKRLFPQASIRDIIEINELGENTELRSGQVLKIRR